MLFIKDQSGDYHPAPKEIVFTEAKRLSSYQLRRGVHINSSDVAKAAIQNKIGNHEFEMFACLFLDSSHRLLSFKEMFRGSVNSATVHPREVIKEALRLNTAAVILAHNHPSGDSNPSRQDIDLTNKLKEILKVIDVRVLDHLVVGDEVSSMADSGHLS
ncbi:MAG: DNA repair protein RadC [Thermodesulfobacteriota bacterium]|nr:DNA repair protein RadC [Thermodesulfobacteriota bacterium]